MTTAPMGKTITIIYVSLKAVESSSTSLLPNKMLRTELPPELILISSVLPII